MSNHDSKSVAFSFPHGLGDACHLCHMIPLWRRRGWRVAVATKPFYGPLLAACGATAAGGGPPAHPWMHPLLGPSPWAPWSGNKVAANLRCDPLPDVGQPGDLWEELLAVRLEVPPALPARDLLPEWTPGTPLVVTHLKGHSGLARKNLPDHCVAAFWHALLRDPLMRYGLVLNMDEERVAPSLADDRLLSVSAADRAWTLRDLVTLLRAATLVVGIDSGILHLCRVTETPALGVWTHNAPWHFALPRGKTRNLAPVPSGVPRDVLEAYRVIPGPQGTPDGTALAKTALSYMKETR